ncbi:MAG: hypothetical protein E7310_05005 [Clostridiales bacterium]|nr:hypothetical protein [Clostridiales bacterium]
MSEKIYKYYSTMRPFDIGTFPKDYVELNNYDERKQVLPGIMAYGEITFNKKLSEEEMKYYELTEDVNKEEALQDIKNLDKINEVLLNKKFYDKGICSIIKKMSELIQKEKEKKAYKSEISKNEYKNVTSHKHIIELDKEEAIRYYADKIVYDCITDCSENNRCFSVDEYENNEFIIENFNKIVERINRDVRVNDLEVDSKKKELDFVFYLEYCPHCYQEDLDISNSERLNHLKNFESFMSDWKSIASPRWFRTNTREVINEYYTNRCATDEEKDLVYNLINEELNKSGFIDKYLDGYTVYINFENIDELLEKLYERIEEVKKDIENEEIENG